MEAFSVYLQLGWQHILDLNGYDHILFIVALAGIYTIARWQSLLMLVTAFTIGHSLTLLLATLQVIYLPATLIELLIPSTIAITCISNWFAVPSRPQDPEPNFWIRYFYAFFFGLIHGMGFSNYLIQLLTSSDEILIKMLAFNVGLELGQIVIVLAVAMFGSALLMFTKVKLRDWNLVVSSFVLGLAMVLVVARAKDLNAAVESGKFVLVRPNTEATDSTGTNISPFRLLSASEDSTETDTTIGKLMPDAKPIAVPTDSTILPQPKVAEPDVTPKPDSESKVEPQAERKPERKAERKATRKTESRSERKADSKDKPKAERKSEPKTERKVEPKTSPSTTK